MYSMERFVRGPSFALIACFLLVAAVPAAGALMSAPRAGQVAVVFPPGWNRSDTLRAAARADSALIRFGSLSNIAVVDLEPGAGARLRAAGAVLILDPLILGGCLAGNRTEEGLAT